MIDDPYYMNAFFVSITIIVAIAVLPLLKYRNLENFPEVNLFLGAALLLMVVILFIGLRNPAGSWRYFGDTYRYTLVFQKIKADPSWLSDKDFGFYFYMKLISQFFNVQAFFFITALFYVLPVFYTFHKWFKKYAFFAVVLFVTSLSFWPFGINGVRNGLATSLFIFALAFRDKRLFMYGIIGISISFHASMTLPLLALLITEIYNNTKLLLKLWLGSIVVSFFFGRKLLGMVNFLVSSSVGQFDGRGDFDGIDSDAFAISTFRIDFVIYSAMVIALGYYFIYYKKFNDLFYLKIFNVYLISNTIWLYFIYYPYTNRVAYLSWFLIPPLVVYPVIYSSKLKNQSYFMAGSVAVSLIFVWVLAYI